MRGVLNLIECSFAARTARWAVSVRAPTRPCAFAPTIKRPRGGPTEGRALGALNALKGGGRQCESAKGCKDSLSLFCNALDSAADADRHGHFACRTRNTDRDHRLARSHFA